MHKDSTTRSRTNCLSYHHVLGGYSSVFPFLVRPLKLQGGLTSHVATPSRSVVVRGLFKDSEFSPTATRFGHTGRVYLSGLIEKKSAQLENISLLFDPCAQRATLYLKDKHGAL